MIDRRSLSSTERALIDTAIALTAGLDVSRTCSSVLNAVETLFDARSSWILLVHPGSGELVTIDFRGPGAETYAGVHVPIDTGIVGVVFSERKEVFVPDVLGETRWFDAQRVHQSGLHSVLTVPLVYDETPVGV